VPYTPSLPLPLPLPSHYLYLYLYHGREGECPVLIRVLETGLAKILVAPLTVARTLRGEPRSDYTLDESHGPARLPKVMEMGLQIRLRVPNGNGTSD